MASNPRRPLIPLNEKKLNPADLWDAKVASGMSPDEATNYVASLHGAPPSMAQHSMKGDSPEDYLRRNVGGSAALKEGIIAPDFKGSPGAGATFLQGAMLNTADEAIGGLRGLMTPGMSMGQGVGEYRKLVDDYKADNPHGATGLEMAGSGIPAAVLGLRAGPVGLARVAKEGAALGAVDGAARGKNIGDRATGALVGAPVGAGAASLGYGVVSGLGKLIKPVAVRAMDEAKDIVGSVGETIEGFGKYLGGKKPITVAEKTGQMGLRALRGARTVSPNAQEVIDEQFRARRSGQVDRILGDMLETANHGRTNIGQTVDQIIAHKRDISKPLYDKALADTPEVPISLFGDLLDRPSMKAAVKFALTNAEESGDRATRDALRALQSWYDKPDMAQSKISSRTAQEIKFALDRVAQLHKTDPISFAKLVYADKNALGHVRNTQKEFLGRLTNAVRGLEDANKAFGGEALLEDRFAEGADYWRTPPERIRATLENASPQEKELYRKRAVEELFRKADDVPSRHDITSRKPFDDAPSDRARLEMLFDDPADFAEFQDRLAKEVRMAMGENAVQRGSNTADKLVDVARMAGVDVGDLLQVATGNPTGLLQKALVKKAGALTQGMTRKKAETMTPFLLATTPEEFAHQANLLGRYERVAKRKIQQRASGLGRLLMAGTLGHDDQ